MTRPTLRDIEVSRPSGALVLSCDKTCANPVMEHRYMGYSKREALQLWRWDHPRRNGDSK